MPDRDAIFFRTPGAWRAWLEAHAAEETQLWVGFHKRGSGEVGITWPESVDQALCFGWIDGRRQSIDDSRYRIRFSPRKPGSIWSNVNVARVEELRERGLMQPAGLAAFARRREGRSGVYSHEQSGEPVLEAARRGALPGAARGLGLLPRAGGLLPQGRSLVDRERQAPGDEDAAADHPDRRLRGRAAGRAPAAAGRPFKAADGSFPLVALFLRRIACARAPGSHTFRLAPGVAEVG